MSQKKIASIILAVFVALIAFQYFSFMKRSESSAVIQQSTSTPIQTITPIETPTSLTPIAPTANSIEKIQNLLYKQKWVPVIITVKGNEFTTPEFNNDDAKKNAESHRLQNAVLANLTKDDFQIKVQYDFQPSFAGMISSSGIEKLMKDSRVIGIELDSVSTTSSGGFY